MKLPVWEAEAWPGPAVSPWKRSNSSVNFLSKWTEPLGELVDISCELREEQVYHDTGSGGNNEGHINRQPEMLLTFKFSKAHHPNR